MSTYSTYWQYVDVEGISVGDGFGYTVTITAENSLKKPKSSIIRKSAATTRIDLDEKDSKYQGSLQAPKSAFINRLSFGRTMSWGSWGGQATKSKIPLYHNTLHNTQLVEADNVAVTPACSSIYDEPTSTWLGQNRWSTSQPSHYRSFYFDHDVEE